MPASNSIPALVPTPAGLAAEQAPAARTSNTRVLTSVTCVVATLVLLSIDHARIDAVVLTALFQLPVLFSAVAFGRTAGQASALAAGVACLIPALSRYPAEQAVAISAATGGIGWTFCSLAAQYRRLQMERAVLRLMKSAVSVEPDVAAVVCDRRGRIAFVNAAAERLLNKRQAELAGTRPESSMRLSSLEIGQSSAETSGALGGVEKLDAAVSSILTEEGAVCGRTIRLRRAGSSNDSFFDIERLSQAEIRLGASEERYRNLVEMSPDAISIVQDGRVQFVNRAALELIGAKAESEVVGRSVFDFVPPDDHATSRERVAAVLATGASQPVREMQFVRVDGRPVHVESRIGPCSFNGRQAVQSVSRDVTERRASAAFLYRRNRILELIATSQGLGVVLDEIVAMMEEQLPGRKCSVLRLEGDRLRVASAPGLPPEYNALVDGIAIGPAVGSCGTAAFRREPVFVADAQSDPLWAAFKDVARQFGVRACWSTPILSRGRDSSRALMGTFAVYSDGPGMPDSKTMKLLQSAEHLACIAMEADASLRELTSSEARFRAFVDHCADALFLQGPDGRVIDVNRCACESLGYSREELVGAYPSDFDPQISQKSLGEVLARLDDGESFSFDSVHRRKDGSVFPVEVRLRPFHSEGRRLCISLAHDISERKRVEAVLRENEARLAEAQEIAGFGSYELDVGTGTARVSAVVTKIFGFEDDQPFRDFAAFTAKHLHPDDFEAAKVARERLIVQGGADVAEQRYFVSDGSLRTFQIRRRAIPDESGRTKTIVGTVQDISERKRFEAELRRRNEEFRLLSSSAAALLAASHPRTALGDIFERLPAHLGCEMILHSTCVSGAMRLQAHRGVEPDELRMLEDAPPDACPWLCTCGSRDAEVADAETIESDPRFAVLRSLGIRLVFCQPLLAGDRMLGRLTFASRIKTSFTLDEVEFMRTLSHYVATAKERLRVESALRESEERGRLALDAAQLGTWRHDFAAGIIHLDERSREHHGIDKSEVVPEELHRSFPKEDLQRMFRILDEEHQPDRPGIYSFEHRIIRRDGEVRWLAVSGRTYFDCDGPERRPVLAIGTTRDVTNERRVETALRQSEETVRRAQEVAHVGSWVFDTASGALSASEEATRIHGWEPGVRTFDDLLRVVHPDDVSRFRSAWGAVCEGMPIEVEHRLDVKGQLKWIVVRAEAAGRLDGKVEKIVGVTQDVTARRRLEDQFRQSQKMEAFGRLAGGVAHDFNNLLTVINGYSDLVINTLSPADPNRDAIVAVRDAGERAARLTQQLLSLSRKAIVEPKLLDLNALVSESTRLFRRVVGEDVEFVLDLEPRLAKVKADPAQLEQALMNLVVNARDAMPTGGRIHIETHNVSVTEAEAAESSDLKPGAYVSLSVVDTGCGMTEDVKANIFEPFFTTKSVGKGSGLGLAVVHGVVKQGGGHVSVSSEPGAGAKFRILLPAAPEAESRPPTAKPSPPKRGSETVLLVEDEDAVRGISRLALEMQGYKVLAASRGAEALKTAEQHEGRIDLLVTDVVMPEMGGRQLADAFRERRPGMKVLYMSGYTDDAVVLHGVVEARDAFLQKPFTPMSLARKVREVLDAKPHAMALN